MPSKILNTAEAIREATAQLLEESPDYYVIGEGITDPKGAFKTTINLHKEFPGRVFDMPVSENGMTGVCIGSAVAGMRPIMVHMRADFLLYAADQIINNAAKWFQMFGGRGGHVPMVIRAVIGRGWGQGVQHSQHLENLFAAIPGLKVVCPSNAYDAKGLLITAARSENPVMFFEHRWIHDLQCEVPDEMYEIPFEPTIVRAGTDLVITAWGYMVHECMKAADFLSKQGIEVAVVDSRGPCGPGENYIVIREESCCPPAPALSRYFYPGIVRIMLEVGDVLGKKIELTEAVAYEAGRPHDVPNPDFRGPF
jgi:pyruvate/2-oxoglutarate/acetoin dehydrogenase E1 component